MKENHTGIGHLLWATAAICLWLVAANAAGLQAAEPFIEADVPLFANRDQQFYRLPSLLVTSRGTVLAASQKRFGGRGDFAPSSWVLAPQPRRRQDVRARTDAVRAQRLLHFQRQPGRRPADRNTVRLLHRVPASRARELVHQDLDPARRRLLDRQEHGRRPDLVRTDRGHAQAECRRVARRRCLQQQPRHSAPTRPARRAAGDRCASLQDRRVREPRERRADLQRRPRGNLAGGRGAVPRLRRCQRRNDGWRNGRRRGVRQLPQFGQQDHRSGQSKRVRTLGRAPHPNPLAGVPGRGSCPPAGP